MTSTIFGKYLSKQCHRDRVLTCMSAEKGSWHRDIVRASAGSVERTRPRELSVIFLGRSVRRVCVNDAAVRCVADSGEIAEAGGYAGVVYMLEKQVRMYRQTDDARVV